MNLKNGLKELLMRSYQRLMKKKDRKKTYAQDRAHGFPKGFTKHVIENAIMHAKEKRK